MYLILNIYLVLTDLNQINMSQTQISRGLEALLEIEDALKTQKGDLNALSYKYFSIVPFSFQRSVINSLNSANMEKIMLIDIQLLKTLQKSVNVSVQNHI